VTCSGEPVSWGRLERHAAGAPDAAAAEHLAACASCRACLERIRADEVRLPALPEPAPRSRWWLWSVVPAAAAAALLVVLVRPRPPRVSVKGAGEVVLSVVRERDGAVAFDPTTFRAGDRWKLRVTCAPGPTLWADVVVLSDGEPAAFPLEAAALACGNDVTLPGAFRLTGRAPARVCVALDVDGPPDRTAAGAGRGALACARLVPE
jgi:hypothetical protein